ncbi:MAG: LysR family transcriptional regulator [Magnetovibrio sp.]|nr:LysR family transcriptional regulator [Magnetovibrio sp.]
MTSAAAKLNVTQGAISQQIKRLEQFLQKPLVNRKGAGLVPTVDGERLFLHAQRLISLNDEVMGVMTAAEFSGVVRLGIPYDIVSPFAAPILKMFAQAYPNVRIELALDSTQSLKTALFRGEIDLTLTTETHSPKGAERLIRSNLVWVGGLNGVSHSRSPLPLVIVNEDCLFRPAMFEALKKKGRDWRLMDATRNMDATLAMLQADIGITALLESTVPNGIQVLSTEDGLPELPEFFINLYAPTNGGNALVEELANNIREQFVAWRRPQTIMTT